MRREAFAEHPFNANLMFARKRWLEYERLIRLHLNPKPPTDLPLNRISYGFRLSR